ncbi:Hypothetical_protein [Hexamita inflata]|uniref:Hypothetical_protein n=1 Tax=Hexamita inflata TaxID=28002 RepID=A0AA86V8P0_9EUKA|nr:Hypothetical protein HINF_LOCUS47103 [Hexamita inflata]
MNYLWLFRFQTNRIILDLNLPYIEQPRYQHGTLITRANNDLIRTQIRNVQTAIAKQRQQPLSQSQIVQTSLIQKTQLIYNNSPVKKPKVILKETKRARSQAQFVRNTPLSEYKTSFVESQRQTPLVGVQSIKLFDYFAE